jgi:hypothetical protein
MGDTFDVQAALRENPAEEVAAHLAQLHGIDRDAYLKEGKTDAQFLNEFGSKPLPDATPTTTTTQTSDPSLSKEAIDAYYSPAAGAGVGAFGGGLGFGASKIAKITKAADAISNIAAGTPTPQVAPVPPEPIEPFKFEPKASPGQTWAAKTGYGAGTGDTVAETADTYRERNKPSGRGKVFGKIVGSLGIDPALEEIKAKEEDAQRFAKIREAERVREEQVARQAYAQKLAKQQAAQREFQLKQDAWNKAQDALKQESKYALINKPASIKPLAGAAIGYNAADVFRHGLSDEPVQAGVSALGAVGSAAPLIKKLPPRYRALGAVTGIVAPLVNKAISKFGNDEENKSVLGHAEGGYIPGYKGGRSVIAEGLAKLLAPKFSLEAIHNMPVSSAIKQAPIAKAFSSLSQENVDPLFKKQIFESYLSKSPEMVKKSGATNYDELTKAAYDKMAQETKHQYEAMRNAGINIDFDPTGAKSYKSSKDMLNDLSTNNHLDIFSGGEPHDLLGDTNNLFRATHDFFGHGTTGSSFGPKGEELAYGAHAQMYSPLAQLAAAAETRGQNSLVNYGGLNDELISKMNALKAQRNPQNADIIDQQLRELGQQWQYAPQKSLILPPEHIELNYSGDK